MSLNSLNMCKIWGGSVFLGKYDFFLSSGVWIPAYLADVICEQPSTTPPCALPPLLLPQAPDHKALETQPVHPSIKQAVHCTAVLCIIVH